MSTFRRRLLMEGSKKKEELPSSIKNSLVGVWKADQNTNDSENKSIIKNLIPSTESISINSFNGWTYNLLDDYDESEIEDVLLMTEDFIHLVYPFDTIYFTSPKYKWPIDYIPRFTFQVRTGEGSNKDLSLDLSVSVITGDNMYKVTLFNETYIQDENLIRVYTVPKIDFPDYVKSNTSGWYVTLSFDTISLLTNNFIYAPKIKVGINGGDLELKNFAFSGNSGYGYFPPEMSVTTVQGTNIEYISSNKFIITNVQPSKGTYVYFFKNITKPVKVRYKGINYNTYVGAAYYDGNFDPSVNVNLIQINIGNSCGEFIINPVSDDVKTENGRYALFQNLSSTVEWEIVPEYEGAVVTDGVDDFMVSKNTISEMGVTDEITVISMVHIIEASTSHSRINIIRTAMGGDLLQQLSRFSIIDISNKSSITGYSGQFSTGTFNTINILGDKNDFSIQKNNPNSNNLFYVNPIEERFPLAWYWTFIANRVLTEDEINQVIAYYNLDKYITPLVYYDVKKQGITNENHTEFGDKLIDFSGNGYDIQLNNIAWKDNSGVGNYPMDYTTLHNWNTRCEATATPSKINITKVFTTAFGSTALFEYTSARSSPKSKVRVSNIPDGCRVLFKIKNSADNVDSEDDIIASEDGIYNIPAGEALIFQYGIAVGRINGSKPDTDFICNIIIEQVPDYPNAVVFDGVDDYGLVEGLPLLKDFTVIADRKLLDDNVGAVVSKRYLNNSGAFQLEKRDLQGYTGSFSFGNTTRHNLYPNIGLISLSKYNYNYSTNITSGSYDDTDRLVLASYYADDPERHPRSIVLYSMLLYPYSLSKFLIQRQIAKLMSDTVTFNPILQGFNEESIGGYYTYFNSSYTTIHRGEAIKVGEYITFTLLVEKDSFKSIHCNWLDDFKVTWNTTFNNKYDCTGYVNSNKKQLIQMIV